jgi:hypothetical protein
MTDASPRPWRFEYDNDTGPSDESFRRFWTLRDANGDHVGDAPTQELAALILSAVNAYDQMREALKAAGEIINLGNIYCPDCRVLVDWHIHGPRAHDGAEHPIVVKITAALAAAGGTT